MKTSDRTPGRCLVCWSEEDTRVINLYVIGSEGLELCHGCEMHLVGLARTLMNVSSHARKMGYKAAKRGSEAKSAA